MTVPKFDDLFNPLLTALMVLGGSASIRELEDEVAQALDISETDLEAQDHQGRSQFGYRLAWARSYLKAVGLVDNSKRGVWALTPKGREAGEVDPDEVKRVCRAQRRAKDQKSATADDDPSSTTDGEEWREVLIAVLKVLDADQFERLCQRVLRESGFSEVEVTGRTGDGGIDGTGIVKLGGLLGFPILFQCKRYKGSVGPGIVRDFRGAMVGRADRGLIMTTGTFTRDAWREATREGTPPIDLVDGEALLDKIRELELGIEIEIVERVIVQEDWFRNL